MSLTGNACVRTGCRISQSLLVVPFIRFPVVTLVAIVLLIGSGCTLQPHRGKQVLNPKIPAEISAPVAEAASPGENVATSEPAVPEGGGGAEAASRGEVAEEPQESPGKQGESPGVLTTAPIVPKTKQTVPTGTAGGGAVFVSLTIPGPLPVALATSAGDKVGGLDPGFSETAEASEDSLETEEVSSTAPVESPAGAGDLINAIVAPGLLIAQDTEGKPEKNQDEAASKPATEEPSEKATEEPPEKTGTDGSSAGAGDWADPDGNESELSGTVKARPSDQTPPAAPTEVKAKIGDGEVTITWKKSDGADSYTINRADKSDPIAKDIPETNYQDSDVENGVAYTYQVTAVDQAGNKSEPSGTIDATPIDPTPAAPAGVKAEIGDGKVTLTWKKSDGANSYAVYRDGKLLKEDIRETTYLDEDAENGVEYSYQVTARRGGNPDSRPLPMGMLCIFGACIALAIFKNTFGKSI